MTKPIIALFGAGVFFLGFQACSNSGSGKAVDDSKKVIADASVADSSSSVAAFDPKNADCTTTRWAGVSDDCWSCLCGTCKDTLDKCDGDCIDILQCAKTKHTLVDNFKQLNCELVASAASCIVSDASTAAAGPLTNLDTCLILAPNKTAFRACEKECGINYTGDVCQRFGVDAGAGSN